MSAYLGIHWGHWTVVVVWVNFHSFPAFTLISRRNNISNNVMQCGKCIAIVTYTWVRVHRQPARQKCGWEKKRESIMRPDKEPSRQPTVASYTGKMVERLVVTIQALLILLSASSALEATTAQCALRCDAPTTEIVSLFNSLKNPPHCTMNTITIFLPLSLLCVLYSYPFSTTFCAANSCHWWEKICDFEGIKSVMNGTVNADNTF